jgi:hypothetical protein
MSLVTVHGPNTMYTASGSGPIQSTPAGGGTVTPDLTNGLKFTLTGAGDRATYSWSWTPTNAGDIPASPIATKNGTVTFGVAGAKTVTCAISGAGTTPAVGSYTYTVNAVSGPRSEDPGVEGASAQTQSDPLADAPIDETAAAEPTFPYDPNYDPSQHTVNDVVGYVIDNPNELEAVLSAEQAGRNRSTLVSHLESMRP